MPAAVPARGFAICFTRSSSFFASICIEKTKRGREVQGCQAARERKPLRRRTRRRLWWVACQSGLLLTLDERNFSVASQAELPSIRGFAGAVVGRLHEPIASIEQGVADCRS